ncbi:MAG TPA: DUF3830 family protein [Chloroflexota bacterium]|jgi:hypothetical protein|nr:DUF3830 family protein [Chloroflexota bacterium]
MPRYIEFDAPDEGITARAELWDERAPLTCELVWRLLPVTAFVHHAIYSGAEVAMVLPRYHELGQEHATSAVLPGEIGFVSLRRDDHFDVEADFSELCFFYDRGARPSMLEGPVKVNLFARFVSGQEALYALCYRMRREGQKRFTVRRG